MAFYFPYTPHDNDKSTDKGDRSQEFENLIGNYFITDHQRTRLITRLVDFVKMNPHASTFMMRSNDDKPKWFRVTVMMEELKPEPEPEPEPTTEPVEEQPTHGVAMAETEPSFFP